MNQALLVLCTLAIVQPWPESLPSNGNVLNLERLGAGVPAGWLLEAENAEWQAAAEPGALGAGAACVHLGQRGHLVLTSPARALRAGYPHAVFLWIHSEPAGVHVSVRLRDNDGEALAGLDQSLRTAPEWQRVVLKCTPAESVKGFYYLEIAIDGEHAVVGMDGLWFGECPGDSGSEWAPAYRAASLNLSPEADWGVVTDCAPSQVHIRAAGTTAGERVCLRATRVDGSVVVLPPCTIDTPGRWETTFTVEEGANARFGMTRVEGVIADSEGRAVSPVVETLLTRVPAPVPGPLPDSPFGIHVQLRDPDLSVMAKFGYKWCRIHDASGITKWGLLETSPGVWEWHDDRVALARRHGFSIVGMLDSAPPWETGVTDDGYFKIYRAPKNLELWRHYVRQVVGHYKGQIDEWEVWNEPWDLRRFFQGGSPALYAALLKAAYEEAKTANPSSVIIGVDTYPPIWETAVLASGAYPYYDMMSWHRYDSNLQGRPNDAPARVAERLQAAQAWYGRPKPTLASEGGIDMTMFQGSFFSFADPAIVGDWSEGADRYARLFLSTLAAGHKRFITYSVHNPPRHGMPNHMMCEPGPLPRPLHASMAALAHFVEGARYRERLIPACDISAHVFEQPHARPFADGPSTVVALIADGAAPEPLPNALPSGVHCYDRWGNATEAPSYATRSIEYLVADAATAPALLDALHNETPEAGPQTAGDLLRLTVSSFVQETPPLWRLFSSQGSLLVAAPSEGGPVIATRAMLRDGMHHERLRAWPASLAVTDVQSNPAGLFQVGSAVLMTGGTPSHRLFFTAVRDGEGHSWRYLTLTLLPADAAGPPEDLRAITAIGERWAAAIREGTSAHLHGLFHPDATCVAASTLHGEYFVFDNPEYLITMLNTAVIFGRAPISSMTFQETAVAGDVAVLSGRWDIASLPLGIAAYRFTATCRRTPDGWRLASFCMGA